MELVNPTCHTALIQMMMFPNNSTLIKLNYCIKLNIKILSLGAPRKAVYKFVKCNPEGDQANCVTQQSPSMAWSPDLPAKLPAATAQYL